MPQVDRPAPNLELDAWVQGTPSNIDQETGNVLLIEVFQVNCPGCFIGGLPEAIQVHTRFKDQPLKVWGVATAFEDYHLNNLENLERLVNRGEVVGETLAYLSRSGMLSNGRLEYDIPFPVAWDRVVKRADREVSDDRVREIIERDFSDHESMPGSTRSVIERQVRNYLLQKEYDALTFDRYGLRGTPSTILIDKKGILRHQLFGSGLGLEDHVEQLLSE